MDPANLDHSHQRFPWSPPPVLWVALACLGAGLAAETTGYHSLWGKRDVFWEYAVPFIWNLGFLHIPGLVLGWIGLRWVRGKHPRVMAAFRYLCLGLLLAGWEGDWDFQRMKLLQGPPWLFLMTDGAMLFLFSFFLPANSLASFPHWLSNRVIAAVFIGPLMMVIAASVISPLLRPHHNVFTSDWEQSSGFERFWIHVPSPYQDMDRECAAAANLAPNPYPDYAGPVGWPRRHRVLYLFERKEDTMRRNPGAAYLTYEWWPDGHGECRPRRQE